MTRSLRMPAMLLLCMTVALGCRESGPELGLVRGRVTLDGEPVPKAFIVFTPETAGRPALARSDADGRFELRFNPSRQGALVGRHQVRVSTEDISGDNKHVPEIIPAKYHRKGSIDVTVESGTNQIDLDLKSN